MMPLPLLLTPGPLTTANGTRQAMLRDWGSRETDFIALTDSVRRRLTALAKAEESHVCIPLQGSGTFAVEAMLGTLVPRDGHVLVMVNGAYGRRMVEICRVIGREATAFETAEDQPPSPLELDRILAGNPAVTHVAAVHCETTAGILNPIEEIAAVVARHGRRLLIDSMSAFGALPVDARRMAFDGLAASANKCLEGIPGAAFVLCRQEALAECEGRSPSVSLDLHAQWRQLQRDGQWRFTPPTHVLAALSHALDRLDAEGGPPARLDRYRLNCALLVDGMRHLGFRPILPKHLQAPIIVTFHHPAHPRYNFAAFAEGLRQRGIVIYPGKLTTAESFRIGCIGAIGPAEIAQALTAVSETQKALGFMEIRI